MWYRVLALSIATDLPFFLIKCMNLNQIGKERAEQAKAAKQEASKDQEEA